MYLNRHIEFIILVWTIRLACCSLSPGRTWNSACITPDEQRIGVLESYKNASVIDTRTGAIIKTVKGDFNLINCYEDGEILAYSSQGAFSLNSEKSVERRSIVERNLRISDNEAFSLSRKTKSVYKADSKGSKYEKVNDGPPLITILKAGELKKDNDYLPLLPERFEGVGAGEESQFEVKPITALSERKLLAAAGFPDNYKNYRQTIPYRWGLFTIDVENNNIAAVGSLKPVTDDNFRFNQGTSFKASGDEKLIAGISGNIITVFDLPSMTETFRSRPDVICGDIQLGFNSDSTLLAISSKINCDDATIKIEVFSLSDKQLKWRNEFPNSPLYLQFLEDNSLVVLTYDRTAFRFDGKSGAVIWKNKNK